MLSHFAATHQHFPEATENMQHARLPRGSTKLSLSQSRARERPVNPLEQATPHNHNARRPRRASPSPRMTPSSQPDESGGEGGVTEAQGAEMAQLKSLKLTEARKVHRRNRSDAGASGRRFTSGATIGASACCRRRRPPNATPSSSASPAKWGRSTPKTTADALHVDPQANQEVRVAPLSFKSTA